MSSGNDVGRKLRGLRRERELSLAQVAEGTDISPSFLSLVENGKSDITFSRLIRLLDFYGISFADLMPERDSSDPVVVRAEERRHVYSPAEGIDVFLLAPDTDRAMMPIVSIYEPGSEYAAYVTHEGEEFILVLEGAIELELEGSERVVLGSGDSAYYTADRSHSFRNASEGPTRLFAVITPSNWQNWREAAPRARVRRSPTEARKSTTNPRA